jgi:enoyl-CoA hydratase/carnithine racemase
MAFSEILYDVSEKIATITLNRPERLNAWTLVMEQEVRQALIEASEDAEVRIIILTGAGRGFCPGADIGNLDTLQQDDSGSRVGNLIRAVDNSVPGGLALPNDYSMRYTYFPTVPKPIIAAVNGPASGIGLLISIFSDLRFASDKAVFTAPFSRIGLVAEHGVSWMLPVLVGHANALDMLFSGRKVSADEAKEMGLVNQVFPADSFMKSVRAYASEMAEKVSPRSTRHIKKQVYEAMLHSLEHSVFVANSEIPASIESEDFKEGIAHFVERRSPNFNGR